jgi:hypothetical protein
MVRDFVPSSVSDGGGASPADGGLSSCTGERKLVEVSEVVGAGASAHAQAGASRNQYINLDSDPAHPEFGRRVQLKARVAPASGSPPLSGKTIYFYFKPDPGNRSGLTGNLKAGFNSAGGADNASKSTDATGWTGTVDFYPSQYGGDKFEVFATDDSSYKGGLSLGIFTVWRKVFYEIDCMTKSPGSGTYSTNAGTADMESAMKKLFIELQKTGTDASPAHRRMISDAAVSAWAATIRDGTGSPRYFHLVLIDTIAWDPAPVGPTFKLPAGTKTIKLKGSTYLLDSSNWFISANFIQGKKTGSIPKTQFTLTETGDPASGDDKFVVSVDFSGLKVDTTKPVSMKLQFTNWSEGSGLQVSKGPATIIGMRWRIRTWFNSAGDLANSTLHTMMHEPGHAMGLAPRTLPDDTANADHYDKNGCHCHALSNKCIMYESNNTNVAFCPHCSDGLRGRRLSALPISGDSGY